MLDQRPVTVPGENGQIAGRLMDVVRQLQKNRESAAGILRPFPLAQNVAGGAEVMSALHTAKQNEQKQNAAPAPGALQKERSQEQGWERNVGQGKTPGRPGQGPQVSRAKPQI
jgi:hypothetical protein